MLLDDVCTWLAESGLGLFQPSADTQGTPTIYAGTMPDAPDRIVVVTEYSGMSPVWGYDPLAGVGGALLERPKFQVMCREAPNNYQAGRLLVEQAFQAALKMRNSTLSGTRYLLVSPLQSPFQVGLDDKRRPLFAFNCDVLKDFSPAG